MNINKSKAIKVIIITFSLFLAVLTVFYFHGQLFKLFSKALLSSAKAYLPYIELIAEATTEKILEETEKTTEEMTTTKQSETESTTQKVTQKALEASVTFPFNHTDEDISSIIEKAKKESAKDKKDGKISEYTYINDGVTDKYGLVRVKNVNKTSINIKKLLEERAKLTVKKDEPAVLIFHTHTTETYQLLDRGFYAVGDPTRSNDKAINMVRVGKEIVEEIQKAGYKVIHDTAIHDGSYNTAYAHSRKSVEAYLKEYPSIKVVLDIHRDAIHRSDGTKIKPTATIKDKKAAQIMIISGCQEKGGPVEGFPNWKENLVFALELQQKLEELFEGITRPLYFSPRKYNMDLTPCSLLVEVGSDANTLDEAVYTGRCLGKAVSEILKKYEE